jgi:hypothetical protein
MPRPNDSPRRLCIIDAVFAPRPGIEFDRRDLLRARAESPAADRPQAKGQRYHRAVVPLAFIPAVRPTSLMRWDALVHCDRFSATLAVQLLGHIGPHSWGEALVGLLRLLTQKSSTCLRRVFS